MPLRSRVMREQAGGDPTVSTSAQPETGLSWTNHQPVPIPVPGDSCWGFGLIRWDFPMLLGFSTVSTQFFHKGSCFLAVRAEILWKLPNGSRHP